MTPFESSCTGHTMRAMYNQQRTIVSTAHVMERGILNSDTLPFFQAGGPLDVISIERFCR